jgi:SHC-transforming protein 2
MDGGGDREGRAQCSNVHALLCARRLTGLEELAWGDDDAAADHNYYNSIPGKEPPLGGLVDSRLAVTQPCALATLGGLGQVSLLWGQK